MPNKKANLRQRSASVVRTGLMVRGPVDRGPTVDGIHTRVESQNNLREFLFLLEKAGKMPFG
jgi:hypothetical protein